MPSRYRLSRIRQSFTRLFARSRATRKSTSPRARCKLAWAAALIVLPAFLAANAQTPAPTYKKSTEASIQGHILSIRISGNDDVYLAVSSRGRTVEVYLAPQRFLKFLGIIFHAGDKVEIVGSRVTSQGAALVLARTIRRNGDEFRLRDAAGVPAWNGWFH